MPVRDPVSIQLFNSMMKNFMEIVKECKDNTCRSTISMFIINLYEIVIVHYTLKYSAGNATFKYVRENLPNSDAASEFVGFRDDIVHNLHKINDFQERLQSFLFRFTKENFDAIMDELDLSSENLYNILLNYTKN